MGARGIDHVSLNVKDIRASVDFYGRVLLFQDPNGVTLEFCQKLK